METKQSVLFFVVAVVTVLFIFLQIRKNKLNIDDSLLWLMWSMLLLVFGVFPGLVNKIAHNIGFVATSNFVLCLFIFFSYFIIFLQSIKISQLKEKTNRLIQKISLFENEIRDKLDK